MTKLDEIASAIREASTQDDWPRAAAIAAVRAMREPDEDMIAAGTRSIIAHGRASNAVCNAWRNMCRSILSQPQEEKVK